MAGNQTLCSPSVSVLQRFCVLHRLSAPVPHVWNSFCAQILIPLDRMDREHSPRRPGFMPPPLSWMRPMTRPNVLLPQNLPWQPHPQLTAPVQQLTGSPGSGNVRPGPHVPRRLGPPFPQDFVCNLRFLDSRSIAGLPLGRWVKQTDWTYRKQLGGCPVDEIPLHAVLYQGYHSYWLRRIAEGKPTFLAGFRISEVVFCHALFQQIRDQGINLDELAGPVRRQDQDLSSGGGRMPPTGDKGPGRSF